MYNFIVCVYSNIDFYMIMLNKSLVEYVELHVLGSKDCHWILANMVNYNITDVEQL